MNGVGTAEIGHSESRGVAGLQDVDVTLGQLPKCFHDIVSRMTEVRSDLSRAGHLPATARLVQDFQPNSSNKLGVYHRQPTAYFLTGGAA
jgi:hypothetical protein